MKPKTLPSVEYLDSLFDYDPLTGVLRWKLGRKCVGGLEAGTPREKRKGEQPYIYVAIDKVNYPIHRIIWKIVTREEPPEFVDHEDLDRQNNRWLNLRAATNGQNISNAKLRKDNKSGTKGVSWASDRQQWQAQITVGGKIVRLGRFDSKDDAIKAVTAARPILHGEFARSE